MITAFNGWVSCISLWWFQCGSSPQIANLERWKNHLRPYKPRILGQNPRTQYWHDTNEHARKQYVILQRNINKYIHRRHVCSHTTIESYIITSYYIYRFLFWSIGHVYITFYHTSQLPLRSLRCLRPVRSPSKSLRGGACSTSRRKWKHAKWRKRRWPNDVVALGMLMLRMHLKAYMLCIYIYIVWYIYIYIYIYRYCILDSANIMLICILLLWLLLLSLWLVLLFWIIIIIIIT